MKFKDFADKINKFAKEHPEAADFEAIMITGDQSSWYLYDILCGDCACGEYKEDSFYSNKKHNKFNAVLIE